MHIDAHKVDIEEKGIKLKLTVVDTPGYGDAIDNSKWYDKPKVVAKPLLPFKSPDCLHLLCLLQIFLVGSRLSIMSINNMIIFSKTNLDLIVKTCATRVSIACSTLSILKDMGTLCSFIHKHFRRLRCTIRLLHRCNSEQFQTPNTIKT